METIKGIGFMIWFFIVSPLLAGAIMSGSAYLLEINYSENDPLWLLVPFIFIGLWMALIYPFRKVFESA